MGNYIITIYGVFRRDLKGDVGTIFWVDFGGSESSSGRRCFKEAVFPGLIRDLINLPEVLNRVQDDGDLKKPSFRI